MPRHTLSIALVFTLVLVASVLAGIIWGSGPMLLADDQIIWGN